MKKTLIYLCMAAAVPAFVSCEKDIAEADSLLQPEVMGLYSLNAAISVNSDGAATRAELAENEDGKLYAMWAEGDAIAVATGRADDGDGPAMTSDDGKNGTMAKYVLASGGGAEGVFSGDVAPAPVAIYGGTGNSASSLNEETVTDYYAAIYPYETAFYRSDFEIGTISASFGAEIPATQSFVEGTFDPKAMPLAGFWKEGDETVYFKPIGAMIHLQLYADAATTLEKLTISSAPQVAGQSYLTTACGLAGEIAISAKTGLYTGYDDPSVDYLTSSNWGVNEFLITPAYDGAKAIEVTGPIELSTDQSNPTDVYVVISPCRLPAGVGFTVTMDTADGLRMTQTATDPIVNKPTVAYVEQPILMPGDILDMPALKFEGTAVQETAITDIQASCNWPYINLQKEEAEADLGSGEAPVWTLDYNSFESENITLAVKLNNPNDGARIQGTEALPGSSINIYEWTDLELQNEGLPGDGTAGLTSTMHVQSRSTDGEGAYLLYMNPSLMYDPETESQGAGAGTTDPNWDGAQDRSGIFTIETYAGEVLGYIKFHQSSTKSTATYAFQSVTVSAGKELVNLDFTPAVQDQTFENAMSLQLLDPNASEQEIWITIKPALNNRNQADGIYIEGLEDCESVYDLKPVPGAEEWLSAASGPSMYAYDGEIDICLKFAAASTNHTIGLRLMDAGGNFCSLLNITQPGTVSEGYNCVTVQGVYPNGANVWVPEGEWMGCIDVIPDGAPEDAVPNTFDLYSGYTLNLPTPGEVEVQLTAAGVYNGDEENLKLPTNTKYELDEDGDGVQDVDSEGNPLWFYPKASLYASVYTYGGDDWISGHNFTQGMIQDAMANSLSFMVAENTTGEERTTTIQFRMESTGFVVGTLTVVQPGTL